MSASLDLDHIRASALRHTHKTGAGFQIYRSRPMFRRPTGIIGAVCWAVLPNLIGTALFLLVVGIFVGLAR